MCSRSIGGDEGFVNQTIHLMRDAVGGAFGTVHFGGVAVAQCHIVVVDHQLRKSPSGLDDAFGVLVKQLEKNILARQQLAKQPALPLI